MHDNKLINAQNETISWTKYVFQNESIRKVRNESIRKVGTKKKSIPERINFPFWVQNVSQLSFGSHYFRSSDVLFHIAF